MNLLLQYIIALGTTSIVLFALAVFVYIRSPRNKVNWAFALYSLSIATWSGCEAYSIAASTRALGLLWWRINHIGVIFIPVFFIHFVMNLLELEKKNRKIIVAYYLIGIVFLILNATPLVIADVVPKFSFKHMVVPGKIYFLFFMLWLLGIGFGLFKLFGAYSKSSGIKRNQLKYLCWTSLIGYLGGPLNFLPAFNIQLFPIMPFGTYGVPLYGLVITYAIIKYRLMDINLALTRAGIFVLVYLFVLGVPFVLGYRYGWWQLATWITVCLATAGPFIYLSLQHRAESRLLAKKRVRQDKLRELSSYMMRFNRLRLLSSLIVHNVLKILQLKHTALYLLEVNADKPKQFNRIRSYAVPGKASLPLSIALESALAKELTQGMAIEREKIKHQIASSSNHKLSLLEGELTQLKAHLIIPAFLRFQLIGFIVLGESRQNEAFTQEDINVLQVLSNQAALAIENALFWEREEEKIAETSKEEAASEISFGAGHQFNNRLYAISAMADSILEMVGDRDVDQMSIEELRAILKKALIKLKKISAECQFGGQITAGIMGLTGTAPPNFAEFDIAPIITSSIELVEMKHAKDQIEENRPTISITNNISQNLPLIFGSDAQIRDCLFNVIDNCFDALYEKEAKIKQKDPELNWPPDEVYTPQIELKASTKDNHLIITVTDNGIGVKEENKKRIFAGYFTTKATSVKGYGPGGHGIGLYTIRKLILAHKGKIHFNSEFGKGTTFTIELPLAEKENKAQDA